MTSASTHGGGGGVVRPAHNNWAKPIIIAPQAKILGFGVYLHNENRSNCDRFHSTFVLGTVSDSQKFSPAAPFTVGFARLL